MRLEDTLRGDSAARFLVADTLVLDRADQRAWSASRPLDLGAKALSLLQELMLNAGVLVTKERLFDVGWPDQAVSDAVLTTAIRELRRALDDPARQPEWIATQHGKGYRFLKDVDARDVHPGRRDVSRESMAADQPRRWPHLLILVAGLAMVAGAVWWLTSRSDTDGDAAAMAETSEDAERASLAILPFATSDVEPWIAGAFVGQIEHVLKQTGDITIVERGGGFSPAPTGIAEARSAGVRRVLTGDVSKSGDTVELVLRLVDTRTEDAVWEQRLSGSSTDLLPLFESSAIAVARSMNTATRRDELAEMAQVGTKSLLAFEEFEKGQRIFDEASIHASIAEVQAGFRHVEKALEHDPQFARAAYLLTYNRWGSFGTVFAEPMIDLDEAYRRHLNLLDVAIVNASNDVERTLYRSQKASATLKLREAVRLLEQYVKKRPNDEVARENLMIGYAQTGNWDGVGRMLDSLAASAMARGQVPIYSPTYLSHDASRAEQWAARLALADTNDFQKFYAQGIYLVAGDRNAGLRVGRTIDPAKLDGDLRNLLELRTMCAEGRHAQGRKLALDLLAKSDAQDGSLLPVAQVGAPDYDVRKLLPPDDTPAQRALLSQFLVNPWLDTSRFPKLRAILAEQGIERGPIGAMPFSCKPRP